MRGRVEVREVAESKEMSSEIGDDSFQRMAVLLLGRMIELRPYAEASSFHWSHEDESGWPVSERRKRSAEEEENLLKVSSRLRSSTRLCTLAEQREMLGHLFIR